jgi:hypothetical protein
MTVDALTDELAQFIETQPVFFVATVAQEGRVNLSPKGMDTLRVVGPKRIVWLNLTGSGNETAAHVAASQRMTLMFMSITAIPMIVRVFESARTIHPRDGNWGELISLFPTLAGSRQLFDLPIDSVRISCGTGVPIMAVEATRAEEELEPFYAAMTATEPDDYWAARTPPASTATRHTRSPRGSEAVDPTPTPAANENDVGVAVSGGTGLPAGHVRRGQRSRLSPSCTSASRRSDVSIGSSWPTTRGVCGVTFGDTALGCASWALRISSAVAALSARLQRRSSCRYVIVYI